MGSQARVIETDTSSSMPVYVTCYLCGRDYGSLSLSIHQVQCVKVWHRDQLNLPVKERRQAPQAPENTDRATAGLLSGEQLVEYNKAATKAWNDSVLMACQYCSRTFFPDKLEKHQQFCKRSSDDKSEQGKRLCLK